jgi:hypothetical protein
MNTTCTICGADDSECKHLSLFVSGSEGINACLNCRIALTAVASHMKTTAGLARMRGFKQGRLYHAIETQKPKAPIQQS